MAVERSTSFAKSVEIDGQQPNTLDQQEPVSGSFNAAAYDDLVAEFEAEGRGSEQVEREQPEPAPRPSQDFSQEVDRDAHYEAALSDHEAAMQHNEKINDDYENMLDDMEQEQNYRENYDNSVDYGNER